MLQINMHVESHGAQCDVYDFKKFVCLFSF